MIVRAYFLATFAIATTAATTAHARDAEMTDVPLPGEDRVAESARPKHDATWTVNARLMLHVTSRSAYAGNAFPIFNGLGASLDGGTESAPLALAPEVGVRRGLTETFGVVASASFWRKSLSADFSAIGLPTSTIGRDVGALRLLADLRTPAARLAGVFIAGGPALDFVRSFSTGYLSDATGFTARPGLHGEGGFALHSKNNGWGLDFIVAYDLLWLPAFADDLGGGGAASELSVGLGGHVDL